MGEIYQSNIEKAMRTPVIMNIVRTGDSYGRPAINVSKYTGMSCDISIGYVDGIVFKELYCISHADVDVPPRTNFDEFLDLELGFMGEHAKEVNVFRDHRLYREARTSVESA